MKPDSWPDAHPRVATTSRSKRLNQGSSDEEIAGVVSLVEAPEDRLEDVARPTALALLVPQPCQRRGRPQLEGAGTLPAGEVESLQESRLRDLPFILQPQKLTLQPVELGLPEVLANRVSVLQPLIDATQSPLRISHSLQRLAKHPIKARHPKRRPR